MKRVLVLGGSPKGDKSVTMEHVRLLERNIGEGEFIFTQPGLRIATLEKRDEEFPSLMEEVEKADVLLLAMPVYYTLIPSGFKRFIELVNERGKAYLFRDKITAVLLTSIQFYDHTALNYLQGICEDWGCAWAGALSLNMHDIFRREHRELLLEFGRRIIMAEGSALLSSRRFAPLPETPDWTYQPDLTRRQSLKGKRAVLISDGTEGNGRLGAMMEKVRSSVDSPIPVYRLDRLMKGGCLGCLKCGFDNRCAWEGKDGYIDAFKEWMEADILIMAGTMKDRYLSSVWKSFFDRSFWRTHQSSFAGKQILWIISGPLSHEQNLQEILYTYAELQEAELTAVITDEGGDSASLDARLEEGLRKALQIGTYGTVRPVTFRRIGGYKVFRDEIFGGLKMVFRRDHKTYRATGIYDFPLRNPFKRLGVFLGYLLTGIPPVQKIMARDMPSHMVMGYKKL